MLARAAKTVGSLRSVGAAGKVQKAKKIHTSSKPKNLPMFSAATLAAEDSKLASSQAYKDARAKFTKIPSSDTIEVTKKALEDAGHTVTIVADKKSALEALQKAIPSGASINLAGSTSLVRFLRFPSLMQSIKACNGAHFFSARCLGISSPPLGAR